MGYYTNYTLEQISPHTTSIEIPTGLSEGELVSDFLSGEETYDLKWYDHFSDMIKVSLANPDVTFKTSGIGEESGDQWKAVFLNGKYKRVDAKIVFDDFNEVDWK